MTHTVTLWVPTTCTLVDGYQGFEETHLPDYQDRSRGIKFPEMFAAISQTVECRHAEYDQHKDLHHCGNLKFYIR